MAPRLGYEQNKNILQNDENTDTALRDANTQGVCFSCLLVVQKRLGSMQHFFQYSLQRLSRFDGSGDMSFSVRHGSHRSIILETV